jgi:ribonuclease-3
MKGDVAAFVSEKLGHEPNDLGLFELAFTHSSVRSESYERLEFLGDRVLGLVIADLLWRRFEVEPEGYLTRRLTHLVCGETLARVANAIGLGAHLVLSRAEATAGAAANPGILADVCEALIAAIYLDGGLEAAAAFIRRFWEPLVDEMEEPPRDPKTALQEWAQARGMPLQVWRDMIRPLLQPPRSAPPRRGRQRCCSTGSPMARRNGRVPLFNRRGWRGSAA